MIKKTLLSFITFFVLLSSSSFAGNIDTMYRFFPVIDDKSNVVSVQPSTDGVGVYDTILNISQYDNLPWFNKLLFELWRKQPDGNYKNIKNIIYNNDNNQIKDYGLVGNVQETIDPLYTTKIDSTIKNEYMTFKKIKVPYYSGTQLKNVFFDVSFKSLNVTHNNDGYPIKIVKNDYASANEAEITLQHNENNIDNIKYVVDLDTSKLPDSVKTLLKDREFDKIYIRDSKQNYYDFSVLNKYAFGTSYSNDFTSDPLNNNFKLYGHSYYYFSELGRGSPTQSNIDTMIGACAKKGGKLDLGNEKVGSSTVLDKVLAEKSDRKSYGIFVIRLCKKKSPLYKYLSIAISTDTDRYNNSGKLHLFIGSVKDKTNNKSQVSYKDEKDLNGNNVFTDNRSKSLPVILPNETLLFDEKTEVGTPNNKDKMVLNIKDNTISYYKYNKDWQRYDFYKKFTPYSPLSKDILVVANENAKYKITANKNIKKYKVKLNMDGMPYGEYMLKITPVYPDDYFVRFKAVNKCYPDMIRNNQKLESNEVVKDKKDNSNNGSTQNTEKAVISSTSNTSNSEYIDWDITTIKAFKDELFNIITNNKLYPKILLTQDKMVQICNDIDKHSDVKTLINNYITKKGGKTLSDNDALKKTCSFLVNNGKYVNLTNGSSITYNTIPKEGSIGITKIISEFTPKDFNTGSTYNLSDPFVGGTKANVKVSYLCDIENSGKIRQKRAFEIVEAQKTNHISGLGKSFSITMPYDVETARTYYEGTADGKKATNCSLYNGQAGYITYNGVKKAYSHIYCLDDTNLSQDYSTLHNNNVITDSNTAIILKSDLDFRNITSNFAPIGDRNNKFNAIFYGNNYKVIIGDINSSSNNYVGFFGVIGSSGKIYDLQVKAGDVRGNSEVGGFAGRNNGIISNSSAVVNSVSGNSEVGGFAGYNENGIISNSSAVVNSVNGSDYAGGFVGWNNNGTISNSSVVVDSVSGYDYVGGFAGRNNGIISNSSAVANSVSGNNYVGGFVGQNNNGIISNSSAVANSVSGNSEVGGFAGFNSGTISNSSAIVNSVSGNNSEVGGFVGYNNGTISNSSAIVNSVSGTYRVGGFIGRNNGTINKSSTAVNSISSYYAGGFIGYNNGTIQNSSAIVNSVSGTYRVGGFIAYNYYNGTIKNSSAIVNSVGGGNSEVGGFVGYNYYSGIINNSVTRVLSSSRVSAGYYENNNNYTNSTNIFTKNQFFFDDTNRDNDGLKYNGTNLSITAVGIIEKKFNKQNYPSAFSSSNNWGQTILNNLSVYWGKNW